MTAQLRKWLREPFHVFAIVCGIAVPLLGEMWFVVTATPITMPRPRWVTISMPLPLIDLNPSFAEFYGLLALNMVAWTLILLAAGRVGRRLVGF